MDEVLGEWVPFATAVAGASAALAGLLVVAMSINLREIIADRLLPPRAAGALVTFAIPLILALLLLVPGWSASALGWALITAGVVSGALLGTLYSSTIRNPSRPLDQRIYGIAVPATAVVVPTVVAGVLLLVGTGGALVWIAVATLAAIVGGLMQAWVLLVEILR